MVSIRFLCYRGTQARPYWMDVDRRTSSGLCLRCECTHISTNPTDSYWSLYTLRANTSNISKFIRTGPKGTFYRIFYEIVLTVGLVGLRAQIVWQEKVSAIACLNLATSFKEILTIGCRKVVRSSISRNANQTPTDR